MSTPSLPPEKLEHYLNQMFKLRRLGEKLMIIPLIFGAAFVVCEVMRVSLLDIKQDTIGYYLVYAALLLLWVVLLVGVLLAAQIFRTAHLAFGVPRALGYLVLATFVAVVPAYFFIYALKSIYGSLFVYLLWPGLFLVPSLIKEEIRRRFGAADSDDASNPVDTTGE